ncbi:NAD(P)/FAD-dependent oxidoreductase [Desulfomicrobium sp. ZS1]|uniref:NAD(P)/FAD-dependent oxidoreductase n=1 Tax=Desulfomicrobium sp. ZS1 TaxID=2952228 RepID=UPI0020B2800F|nr:NAD(P)/FAD-dependent oxidoreductase [Desulfomicrobium sp. ZS1]UTF51220.1 NAD(P)/FAD-dependent oxidoreductase [Desulfomicrobium sp. ZS1]
MESVDILIIGQGPAGLSSAIYTARAGMRTLILGCAPKVAGDYEIDNYFGFTETITGKDLIERGKAQAAKFGADIRCDRVLGIHQNDTGAFLAKTEDEEIEAASIILATGVSRIRPGISNLGDYEGKGVSYCVSCDGFFMRGKPVLVVGEGNFAANQGLELLQYTPNVQICSQGKELAISEEFLYRLEENNISILEDKIVTLAGEHGLETAQMESGQQIDAQGLFIAMGQASSSDFAYSLGLMRNGQFIETDREQRTNVQGVFAAGDCVGRFMQISVAVGEGALAGRAAISHVKERRRELLDKEAK